MSIKYATFYVKQSGAKLTQRSSVHKKYDVQILTKLKVGKVVWPP